MKTNENEDIIINNLIALLSNLISDQKFWEEKTKFTVSALPKGIGKMELEIKNYNKKEYKFISDQLDLLRAIGAIAADKKRDFPLIGKLLAFKDKKLRADFTFNLYAILEKLESINDKNDPVIANVDQELHQLLADQQKLDAKNTFGLFALPQQDSQTLEKLGLSNRQKIYYLYSNDPSEKIFAEGINKQSMERALTGQGYIDISNLPKSMYIIVNNNNDPGLKNKFLYTYIIDSPAAISTEPFTNHNDKMIKDKSLIPRMIEPREIVGCCENKTNEVFRNPQYTLPLSFDADHILFRGDSRPYEDSSTRKGMFQQGFLPLGSVSDDALNWSNQQTPTIYVSSSDKLEHTIKFPETIKPGETRYIYVMYKPDRAINAKDIPQLANNIHSLTDREFLVPSGISSEYIVGAYTYKNGIFEKFTFNPNSAVTGFTQDRDFFTHFNLPQPEQLEVKSSLKPEAS